MIESQNPIAVIYCRVSSNKQTKHGDGLASQETRCLEYARYKDYEVAETFRDEGVSGSVFDRPAIKAMLIWLREHRAQDPVVIIDDISRLARDTEVHRKLRSAFASMGARLESPSIEFGDDSDSFLVENLLASVSQHQRQKNGEQVVNRMRARLLNGYWPFCAPIGYRYERIPGQGKMLVPDEPAASILREALEGFASGRFQTQSEVKRFLHPYPVFARDKQGEIHGQRIKDLLTRSIYAGHYTYEPWNVRLTQGKHTPLISFETFERIQRRLAGTAYAPTRKAAVDEFPLRGFVTCGCCEKPMTACWSKGRNRKYPYYLCATKGCSEKGKSIRKERLEEDFEAFLQTLQPSPSLFKTAAEIFRTLWDASRNASKPVHGPEARGI